MPDCKFHVGRKDLFKGDSPGGRFSAFFEDHGDTGYFYALDLERADDQILDAVQVYNVANVVDADPPSELSIIWSADGLKCALLINGYPPGLDSCRPYTCPVTRRTRILFVPIS
jgi:hypothetical protein